VKAKSQKYAFCQSPGIAAAFGKDVFILPSIVGDELYAELSVGLPIEVEVDSSSGQPRAISVTILTVEPSEAQLNGRICRGTVKSKSDKYGFIQCAELSGYGKDTFVIPGNLGVNGNDIFASLAVGTQVAFTFEMDHTKGQPRATSAEIISGDGAPAEAVVENHGGGGPRSYTGVVKTKSDKYGFIDSPEAKAHYGKDIFFIPSIIGDDVYATLTVGAQVEATVEIENGRPRATSVTEVEAA
jgi:cold shock CspA family protein